MQCPDCGFLSQKSLRNVVCISVCLLGTGVSCAKRLNRFLPHVARLHASVVYAVAVYPFVCLSVRQKRCCIEMIGQIALVLGVEASFHLSRTVLSPKIRALPSGTCALRAKFHYTGPTGPARTQRSFAAKKSVRVRAGPVGSVSGPCRVRVRVVEFSSSPTMCADFVRVGSGPCRVRVGSV